MSDDEIAGSLVINSANTSDSSSFDGKLEVTGAPQGAAIGGPGNPASNGAFGAITINGGTIIAKGGKDAAGIGGGTITINDGDVDEVEYIYTEETVTDYYKDEIETSYKLSEISQFYNLSSTFLVSQPQILTITQGNDQSASVTLYETDTMQDVAHKINTAIADGLGQASTLTIAKNFAPSLTARKAHLNPSMTASQSMTLTATLQAMMFSQLCSSALQFPAKLANSPSQATTISSSGASYPQK